MKKYLIILSVLAFVACNDSKKTEDQASETANRENEIRQRTIDSMAALNSQTNHPEVSHSSGSHHHSGTVRNSSTITHNNNTVVNENTADNTPTKKKGMSNKTKGALIGTGVGILTGAATGAATSENKGEGAVIGGVIGGAVGSGAGYGIGAERDKKNAGK